MVEQKRLYAIHFGAGNVGRGFIGPLLVQAGYHVKFADIDKNVIEKTNKDGEYVVHILEPKQQETMTILDVSGIISTSDLLPNDIASPRVKLITTSVGFSVLPKIASPIAKGISQRRKVGCGPMNIIACENGVGATNKLREAVFEYLSDEDKKYANEQVGFANCSVDRIVPPFDNNSPLDVGVEAFHEWIVERKPLKGISSNETLGIEGMTLTDDLSPYVERKLFTLNCGHVITAYLGFLKGYSTILNSIKNTEILHIVEGAMQESVAALVKRHSVLNKDEQQEYIKKTLDRFRNSNVVDDVKRVGRQPLRKLGKNDRLLGAVYTAREYGLPIDNLAHGVAAAMLFENNEDEQAVELNNNIEKQGIRKVITEVTGFKEESEEFKKILEFYDKLKKWKSEKQL